MRPVTSVLLYLAIASIPSVVACGGTTPETEPSQGSHVTDESACTSLTGLDLIDLRITASERVPTETETPVHCRVTGVIESEINFELLLPDDWNGRLLMGGGGGFVGSVQNQAMSLFNIVGGNPLSRGYATVGTDTGHDGEGIEAAWALDHPERQENFGHRAVHLTAETAKSILRHYYGEPEQYSYFMGCSRGGGQAMTAETAKSILRHYYGEPEQYSYFIQTIQTISMAWWLRRLPITGPVSAHSLSRHSRGTTRRQICPLPLSRPTT